ncbi:protein of unknown function DUF6 transmembrane [Gloeothece citriformis PCC 7424]|uniref:EamA domain-containing protein n=1 Tax=Gloeothece citriformis (strain PCC 7424) TaxID=65393 RepID=B7KA20_GLOC7|nr:DMT family transporter [Gloeothece citriformis]ACK71376.1 protein of unknown function DUF6 transmembrane [Gloeothece citriformis PCC 7424]
MTKNLVLPQPSFWKNPKWIAVMSLCLAVLCISIAAIFIKFCEQEISPCATAFNRFWVTTLILGLWNGLNGERTEELSEIGFESSISGVVFWQLVLVGLFLGIDLLLWSWSLTQTSVANATLLANLTPIFTSVGMWAIWGKRFDRKFILGMSVALLGALGLGVSDLSVDPSKLGGDLAAILAALSFAGYLFVLEKLQHRLNALTITKWSSAIASLALLPVLLFNHEAILPTSWQGWIAVLGLALICQILGQVCLVQSLNGLSCGFVAIFLLLEPILAAFGAWIVFSETLTLLNWLAFAVVLLGIYIALCSQSSVKDSPVEGGFNNG